MLLNRQQLNAALFVSDDVAHPDQHFIRVDPDGTVWATNGHVAVRVKRTVFDDADFPKIDLPDSAETPKKSVLIPAQTALAVAKTFPKSRYNLPVLANALLRATKERIYLAVTDLERPQVTTLSYTDEKFPGVEHVYKDQEARVRGKKACDPFGINAEYLALVAKYAKMFELGPNNPIKITSYEPVSPISFEWADTNNGLDVHVIVALVKLP